MGDSPSNIQQTAAQKKQPQERRQERSTGGIRNLPPRLEFRHIMAPRPGLLPLLIQNSSQPHHRLGEEQRRLQHGVTLCQDLNLPTLR